MLHNMSLNDQNYVLHTEKKKKKGKQAKLSLSAYPPPDGFGRYEKVAKKRKVKNKDLSDLENEYESVNISIKGNVIDEAKIFKFS